MYKLLVLIGILVVCFYIVKNKKKNKKMISTIIRELSLKLDTPFHNKLVDKYTVREYIKSKKTLFKIPKLYAHYSTKDELDEVNMYKYPNNFVYKCNNGSGMNLIIKDRKMYNNDQAITNDYLKRKGMEWLNSEFWKQHNEVQYKNIKNKVLVEELLLCKDGKVPSDIKMFMFHGRCHFIMVIFDRFKKQKVNIYTRNGNLSNYKSKYYDKKDIYYTIPDIKLLVKEAEKLAKGIDMVRIDIYDVDGEYYFGEFTFTPWGGNRILDSEKAEIEWGSLI